MRISDWSSDVRSSDLLIKSNKRADKSEKQETHGMDYLPTLPRRLVTIYIPLGILVFILLFPFYWMAMTAIKPNAEMLLSSGNPFWVIAPTLQHFKDLLFNTPFTEWLVNTVIISVVATFLKLTAIIFGAYAIERLRFQGAKMVGFAIFFAYLLHPSILIIPLASIVFNLGRFDTRWAFIIINPNLLNPF